MSGNVNLWADGFSENIALAKMTHDGSTTWLKDWSESFEQLSQDVGDNGELGGSSQSVALDSAGDLYVAGRRSQTSSNSVFQALLFKVDGDTGDMEWATGATNGSNAIPTIAAQSLQGSAVDASLPGRVFMAGKAEGAGMLLSAFDSTTGDLDWAMSIQSGGIARAGGIVVDGTSLYVGGIANNKAFVARIDDVDGETPTLAWSQTYGSFSIVRSLSVEGGTLLACIDKRGLPTSFVATALSTTDGSVIWAKVWDDNNADDNDNSLVARIVGGDAIIGGRISFSPFDTGSGDGFLLRLALSDGAYRWGSFFYNGKGAEELTRNEITGMAEAPDGSLWVVEQSTPGALNQHHFWGRWYQANDDTLDFPAGTGSERLSDFTIAVVDVTATTTFTPLSAAQGHSIETAAIWINTAAGVTLDDAFELEGAGFQTGVHALVQQLEITD